MFNCFKGAHFNNMYTRYGSPAVVINLVKKREKKLHESQLSDHLLSAVKYLNRFLPPSHHIQYIHFDMARMNKRYIFIFIYFIIFMFYVYYMCIIFFFIHIYIKL